MRGATSHDGKMSGNRQLIDAYDKDKGHGAARRQEPKSRGGESGGVHDESGHDEIKHVVGEHGEAHKHIITKKEDGSGYQSETHHDSGHVHHHDHHDSIEHAHAHGAYAMGDSDHLPADEEAGDQMHGRSMNEREHSGSGSSGVDFLPGEG